MRDFRLCVFISVARSLSFTKTADELYITQPAVTRHIKELESQLQLQLFERLGNKIKLTPVGEVCLKHAEAIDAAYKKLTFEANLIHNHYTGELKLGASTTIAQYVLPSFLVQFTKRFPDIRITLINGNSLEVENALQDHRIDLGLVEGKHRLPNLKYTTFMADELVAITSTNSKWASFDEMSLEEFRKVPLVLRENGSGTLEVFHSELRRNELTFKMMNVLMQLGSTESIKRYLENTDTMGVVSIRSIDRELYSGSFKVVEINGLQMNRDFDFVENIGMENSLVKLFTDLMIKLI